MTEKIKAIHDNNLEEFFESLGINSKFQAGKLSCAFCKEVVNFDNLHSVFPDSGAVKLACSKPKCVMMLMIKLEEKNYGRVR